ncbi:MAG: integrase core domain-containing protein [Planctomycetota bacterium]|jgi:transposase InsO family protein
MPWITHLLVLTNALVADRSRLALENIALRQQIVVLKRSVGRAKIDDSDRIFWILMRRLLDSWRDTLLIVKPETVIKWHRKGWRYYWRRKSQRGKPGRPKIDPEVIELIRRLSRDNATWGAPRIQSELALLGHRVAVSTVAKYMVRHPKEPWQSWRTFLANHMSVTAACDFFVVPTLTFKALYCFVVLSHERRRIVHVNVTRHPTDEWTARQVLEAFPGDGFVPEYLHRDRDSIYGSTFRRTVSVLGITQVISARQSPWQNPFAERLIGSIRRECTDHIIPLGERHLVSVLLDRNSPSPRFVENGCGDVIAIPHLGGLHHRYARAA